MSETNSARNFFDMFQPDASRGNEMVDVFITALREFSAHGGKIESQKNPDGMTIGMFAALYGADTIEAFGGLGGKFDNTQNNFGMTAGMYAVRNSTKAIQAYANAGGIFDDTQDYKNRKTAAGYVLCRDIEALLAFIEVGGMFSMAEQKLGVSLYPKAEDAINAAAAPVRTRGTAAIVQSKKLVG